MKKFQVIVAICFILFGVCLGIITGFVIVHLSIPSPIEPDQVRRNVRQELMIINGETGGQLEGKDYSENKWLSKTYNRWFYSLSKVEQNIIKFRDRISSWLLWLIGIGIIMLLSGIISLKKLESYNQ